MGNKEVKEETEALRLNHKVRKWWGPDSNLSSLTPWSVLFLTRPMAVTLLQGLAQ